MNDIGAPSDTSAALLDAARDLFAEHGYEGASVRAITMAAGANLGAITYHFGSKRELYDQVVASIVVPLAERVERVVGSGDSALWRAGEVVRTYFEYLRTNPDLPPLMMQELVLSGVPPASVAGPMKRILVALSGLIAEGQERGEVRAGPVPLLSIFILSVPVHLSLMRRGLETIGGVDLGNPAMFESVVSSAREFVESGLGAERGA